MGVIAAIVARGGFSIAADAPASMLDPTVGPGTGDRLQAWQDQRVGLGARSIGNSALFDSERAVVVADARLDDRVALCSELGLRESCVSDAALIAASYTAFGDRFMSRLRGEFAFALWDQKRNLLVCARDRFGVRPLLYRNTLGSFRVATYASALACDTGLSALPISESWVVDLVSDADGFLQATPYEGIHRLPPGHILRLVDGAIEISPYWSFAEIRRETRSASAEEIRDVFTESVRRRMRGTDVGAFLSGGLDSSSICCVARDLRRAAGEEALRTVSIVFDSTPAESERPYIEAVMQTGGFSAELVNVTNYRPIADLEGLVSVQEGPFFAPGLALLQHGVSAAAAAGLREILDGHGGDETLSFAGYGRLIELARQGSWFSLCAELSALTRNQGGSLVDIGASLFARYGRGPLARVCRRVYPALRRKKPNPEAPRWLSEQWRERATGAAPPRIATGDNPGDFDSERDYHERTASGPLQAYAFEVQSRLFRAHGIEPQYPFWDQDVVELSLRLPARQKLHGGYSRAALRDAMSGIVPDAVRLRHDKLNFSSHLVRGLVQDEDVLLDMVNRRDARCFEFVEHSAFASGVNDLRMGQGVQRVLPAQGILSATMLDIWFRSRRNATSAACAPLETTS